MKKPLRIFGSGGVKILFGVNLGVNTKMQKLNSNFSDEKYAKYMRKPALSKNK